MGRARHRRAARPALTAVALLGMLLTLGLTAPSANAAANRPPVFADTSNNTAQTINSGSGLARLTAADADNDPLSYSTATPTALPDGIALEPDGTFAGVTTNPTNRVLVRAPVAINVTDGHGGSAATELQVTVLPAPDVPPDAHPDAGHTTPGTAVTVAVLANDTDASGDPLTVISFSQGSRNSAVDCTAAGQCLYTPASAVGTRTEDFSYVVSDGRGGTATGTVTITLDNVKPVFTQAPVNTSQSVAVGGALAPVRAIDGNGDPVSYALTSGPQSLPSGITAVAPDGHFSGTPSAAGTFHLSVSADDDVAGGGPPAATALTVTVTTAPALAPDKPVARPDRYPTPDALAITPGTTVTLPVLSNDSDSRPLTIIDYDTPSTGGTVGLGPAGTTLLYTPRAGFLGTDSFTYTVSDGLPGGTDVGQVTVVVSAPDDQPPAFTSAPANSTQNVASGTPLTPLSATDPDTAAALLRFSVTSGILPVGVTLDPSTGAFAGTPTNAGTTAVSDTVTVTVSDGTLVNVVPQSLTITVAPQPRSDRAPTPADDAVPTPNGQSVSIAVLGNDTDPDGDPLSVSGFDPTSLDGGAVSCTSTACTYSPAPGTRGDDTFAYTVTDGVLTASATVTVTVGTARTPTVTAADDTAGTVAPNPVLIRVLANDTDSAGYPLSASAATQPGHGAVTCSGPACTYTPATGYTGEDTFTYLASDGQGGSATGTVAVAVVAPTVPTITVRSDAASTPAGRRVVVAVVSNDTDSAGLPLTVIPAGLPRHGLVSCAMGACTYTPNAGYSGTDAFTYAASDGSGGSATGSVVVTVRPPSVLRGRMRPTVLTAGSVTITLTVGVHPNVPLGGSLVRVTGSLAPGTTVSRDGVFRGAATRTGRYVAVVTVSYKGVPVQRRLVVTVRAAASTAAAGPGTTAVRPTLQSAYPAGGLAMTGTSGLQSLLSAGLGLLGLGMALAGGGGNTRRRSTGRHRRRITGRTCRC